MLKSKVKFTESQKIRKEKEGAADAGSDNGGGAGKKKSKKNQKIPPPVAEVTTSDAVEDESTEETSRSGTLQPELGILPPAPVEITPPVINNLTLSDLDKDVSDGSISDMEVPLVKNKWPTAAAAAVCPMSAMEDNSNGAAEGGATACSVGVKLTMSQKVTPCVKSDDQDFATTDYATSAAMAFIPALIHPINGQVSTFTRHREFTDYLRSSGCLRLFGTCILSVYRMKTWPPPENLMEQMLNAMGHQIPSRKQVAELTNRKQDLIMKLKLLTKERCQLLERLDQYQDCAAKYELLDQDEILPPRPENSPLNLELMKETFEKMQFIDAGPGDDANVSSDLKVGVAKPAPVSDTLPIPFHDKRMLH